METKSQINAHSEAKENKNNKKKLTCIALCTVPVVRPEQTGTVCISAKNFMLRCNNE